MRVLQLKRVLSVIKYGLAGIPFFRVCAVFILVSLIANSSNRVTGLSLLGGIPRSQIVGEIDYSKLSIWLMIIATPLLISSYSQDKLCKTIVFLFLRIKSWRVIWLAIQLIQFIIITIFTFIMSSMAVMSGGAANAAFFSKLLLFWLHLIFLSIIIFRMTLIQINGLSLTIVLCLITEGVSYSISQRFPRLALLFPGTWGMYEQSSWRIADGFPADIVVFLECFVIFTLLIFIPKSEKLLERGG